MRPNKLRELLESNKPTLSTHIHTTWPSVVEAVAAAPGAAGVRVWAIMSGGRGPRGGRAVPEGANVDYPLAEEAAPLAVLGSKEGCRSFVGKRTPHFKGR